MHRWVWGSLVLLAACATARVAWAPIARAGPRTCDVPGAPAGSSWQLVLADDFTFCVPPDWRPRDDRRWEGGSGWVAWGIGLAPRRSISGTVVVAMPVAQAATLTPGSTLPPDLLPAGAPLCSTDRSAETVDGRRVDLRDAACDDTHLTGAQWRDPQVYLEGQASDAVTAANQLQVFRTVRFLGPPARRAGAGRAPPPN